MVITYFIEQNVHQLDVVGNAARRQLQQGEKDVSLSPFAPDNSASRN